MHNPFLITYCNTKYSHANIIPYGIIHVNIHTEKSASQQNKILCNLPKILLLPRCTFRTWRIISEIFNKKRKKSTQPFFFLEKTSGQIKSDRSDEYSAVWSWRSPFWKAALLRQTLYAETSGFDTVFSKENQVRAKSFYSLLIGRELEGKARLYRS